MNLNLEDFRKVTLGAERVEQTEDGVCFFRFTKEQEELYKKRGPGLFAKTFATSGVQMRFRTNSKTLFMRVLVKVATGRNYFSFDFFVNGVKFDSLDNFSNVDIKYPYTSINLPFGEFYKEINLLNGEKEVCVYFPWSANVFVKEFIVDDGSYIIPVKPNKKLLCFGDSITQGYDALHTSNKYTTRLANALDAEEFNKAIGGEIFFPELAATKEDFVPDYVTVAYGTNDWCHFTKDVFNKNCKEFICNVAKNYNKSKIYLITPIWRKDNNANVPFGKFSEVESKLIEEAKLYDNVFAIKGIDLLPHDEKLYADFCLHPDDNGFKYYFENLTREIIK